MRLSMVWEGSLWIQPFPLTQKEEFREYETSHCVGGSGLRKIKSFDYIHAPTQFLTEPLIFCAILDKQLRFYL